MRHIPTKPTPSVCSKSSSGTTSGWSQALEEILYRYVAIDRRDAIQPAFDALTGMVDEVLAVDRAAVERAKRIVLEYQRLSARDAVHLAVMEQHGIDRILSFNRGFDGFAGITRFG